jgi:hypothetical protein
MYDLFNVIIIKIQYNNDVLNGLYFDARHMVVHDDEEV